MSNTSNKYTRYFKEKVLEEWARGKRPTWVAREFGIDRTTLYRWYHQWFMQFQRISAPETSQPQTADERALSHHDALYAIFSTYGTITMPKTPHPHHPRRSLSKVDKSPSAAKSTFVWLLPLANC